MAGFLVDENLPARLVEELSSRGFVSQHVADTPSLRASSDDEIVAHAVKEALVIITKDKELSFVTRFPEASRYGVVCVRISDRLSIDAQVRIVVSAITSLDWHEFANSVVVVEPGRVRVRRAK